MNSTSTKTASQTSPHNSHHRVAVAACFGTFLEWYDFLTFAALAVWFGPPQGWNDDKPSGGSPVASSDPGESAVPGTPAPGAL